MIVLVSIFSLMATQYSSTRENSVENSLKIVKAQKLDKIFVWLVFLCLAFVAAFRYGVGTDFFSYYNGDNWANKFEERDYSDPGFTLLALLCNIVFYSQKGALTLVSAVITVALFVFTIAKKQEDFPLSILLFIFVGCFTGMFNGVRQYLAAAILFAGHRFIIEKKPIRWFFVVLLASSFHITAILMFFIYFVCNLKCNWMLLIAIILLLAYEPLFHLVGALKQDEIDMNNAYMSGSVNKLRVAVQCVPILLLFFLNKDKINNDKEARFLLNICLLNAAIAIAAMNSPYFSRFCIYTSCFQIFMYPKVFSKMRKDDKNLFVVLLLFFYALFWGYEVLNSASLKNFNWIFSRL